MLGDTTRRSFAEIEPHVLIQTRHIKSLLAALKPLANPGIKKAARVIVTAEGLRCLVETDLVAQMQASLSKDLFDAFLWTPEDAEFGAPVVFDIDLGLLLDSLAVFQGAPEMDISSLTLSIRIPLDGHQVSLSIRDEDSETECKIQSYDSEPIADLMTLFNEDPCHCKVIVQSGGFKEGLLEMDTSVTEVEILVYTEAPFFRISGSGIAGDILIDYPRDNRVFDAFECSGLVQFSYKFSILQTCLKALAVSKKTSLRINEQGLLSLQFMVPQHDAKLTFIEFVMSPMADQ